MEFVALNEVLERFALEYLPTGLRHVGQVLHKSSRTLRLSVGPLRYSWSTTREGLTLLLFLFSVDLSCRSSFFSEMVAHFFSPLVLPDLFTLQFSLPLLVGGSSLIFLSSLLTLAAVPPSLPLGHTERLVRISE
jgi:hypothetical protein